MNYNVINTWGGRGGIKEMVVFIYASLSCNGGGGKVQDC